MKIIPNKKLNDKQVSELLNRKKIVSGGEAMICESDNPYTLYKVFSNYGKIQPMGENKKKKIFKLYQMQLDYSVKPINTISYNDMIIGYEMSSDYDLETYNAYQLTREELIYFLKSTKTILEYFSSKDIVYADINPKNILFNRSNGEIQFCDIDNIQIDSCPIDKIPSNLMEYNSKRGIDDSVHPFMHNLMTLQAYYLDVFCSTSNEIKKIFKKPSEKIILSMQQPQKFNNEYIISYIRKRK